MLKSWRIKMKNKIKIAVIDFDGTACEFNHGNFSSSWEAFSNVCGVNKELNQLLDDYYHCKRKEEWMTKKGVKLFSGKSINLVDKLKPFPYSSGFVNFVNSRNGFLLGFLSSGLNIIVDEAAKELNLDFSISTELETKNGIITGNVKKIIPLWNKEKPFLELLKKYNFLPEQSCYVGDNENDISCFRTAGISVAYNPKTNDTMKTAKYVINDFKELNKILELK
jgi:phosphoserine phosphatase